MKTAAILILLLLLMVVDVQADFNHENTQWVDYAASPTNSCYRKEIDELRQAAGGTLQGEVELRLLRAQAYDRLAELGQTC